MTENASDRDELVDEIRLAVADLGRPEDHHSVALPELAQRLASLHAGLQSALTELDRA